MSIIAARKKRTALYLSIGGLLATVAAVSAVSARDPSGVTLRVGMIMMTVGAAMWLPWRALIPTVLAIWLGPNYVRCLIQDETLFGSNMLLELPGLVGLGFFAAMARSTLRGLEDEDVMLGATSEDLAGVDQDTGVYEERLLQPALEAELVRSRRFNREFALVLVGIDSMRQRFDYHDEEEWESSFNATAQLLRTTRTHIDRAYRFGVSNFALILPESSPKEVTGLIKRLRRQARQAKPPEGQPGGPMATHFGATFFPQCATNPQDMIRRAEIALRIAEKNSNRIQLDGAEAPDMPAPETLRREADATASLEAALATVSSNGHLSGELAASETAALQAELEPGKLPETASELLTISEQAPAAVPEPVLAANETVTDEPVVAEPVATAAEPVAATGSAAEPAAPEESGWPSTWVPAPLPKAAPIHAVEQIEAEPAALQPITPRPELVPTLQVVQTPAPVKEKAPVLVASVGSTPEAAAKSASAQTEPELGADLADVLKHLDETLSLIRKVRTGSSTDEKSA